MAKGGGNAALLSIIAAARNRLFQQGFSKPPSQEASGSGPVPRLHRLRLSPPFNDLMPSSTCTLQYLEDLPVWVLVHQCELYASLRCQLGDLELQEAGRSYCFLGILAADIVSGSSNE
ncbi:hypothetical protein PABG_05956 [Paracoccidioides brasiliensis Pb03]|nr:hypothetical protein PABG_05956 [Paracoccidioides brasiliensis Pb03]ODH53253.1 hypothetical protein GX48_00449 [Paracoccidioides brasiliensis]